MIATIILETGGMKYLRSTDIPVQVDLIANPGSVLAIGSRVSGGSGRKDESF